MTPSDTDTPLTLSETPLTHHVSPPPQGQVRELEGCAPPLSDRLAFSGDPTSGSDSLRLRPPAFLAETPWDGSVTRRVKRAYSSLDACSVRMGVFLKRYPIARIFVLGYMVRWGWGGGGVKAWFVLTRVVLRLRFFSG